MTIDHEVFQSHFAWRYGSEAMRRLWSEAHRRRLMRQVWLALAEAQHEDGIVSDEQIEALRQTAVCIDIERAAAIEAETHHDVMAEVRTWAEQAPAGGAVLHLGATSADITDNVDAIRLRDALGIIDEGLSAAIEVLAQRIDASAELVTVGWTHLQPAALTTVGYRLASTVQDLLADLEHLDFAAAHLRAKGFKGAVGTGASFAALLEGHPDSAAELEARAMRRLDLVAAMVTTQVYPRKVDWLVLSMLAGIAATAARFAFNVRVLQSPPFGEWAEPFSARQVGSTAMPWKRNPIGAENIDSLARLVAALPEVAWHNEASSLLERTLDDSANRRIVLPEAFLATDEILRRLGAIARGLVIDEAAIRANVGRYGPFAAVEAVLMAASAAGGDRQALHERLRQHSLAAWAALAGGQANPLAELVAADPLITANITPETVRQILAEPERHVGDAAGRARHTAEQARQAIAARARHPIGPPSTGPGAGARRR